MIEIVTPRVVPNMPPAPLTSDPPQVFDDKCIAQAAGYPATIGGMNGSATDTNQNALAAKERAEQAQTAWSSVSSGVATINAALAAIQAGPVVSVNGKSGVVSIDWSDLPGRGPSVSNINDNTLKSDVYRVTAASTGTRPYGFSGAAVLVVESSGSAYTSQRYLDTWTSSEFRRYFSNGAWTYWSRVSLQTDSHVVANDGNLNLWLGNYFSMTVNGAATIKIDDATMGGLYGGGATQYGVAIEVNLVSGSIAFANAVKWVGGAAPTFTVGKKHIIFMQREKNGPGYWLCSAQMGYAI